jgi:hypothetical protein
MKRAEKGWEAIIEQRERAAADIVKVLEQTKAELARARELLMRLSRRASVSSLEDVRRPRSAGQSLELSEDRA